MEEAEVVEHYERIQNLGYSHHNRGVGLGFGGMHAAAPPASLLRQCAQVGDRLNLTLALTVTVTVTLTLTLTLTVTVTLTLTLLRAPVPLGGGARRPDGGA